MMYSNKAACAVKVNGKVLREFKDTVFIPFGSEYSILIKNLNSKRAIFNIFIDGDNIVPNGLVLNAGQEIDLERAIRNNNLNEGNRFRFIERTGDIEEHRGVKLEDGLIRVEYQFEREYVRPTYPVMGGQWPYNNPSWTDGRLMRTCSAIDSSAVGGVLSGQLSKGIATCAMNSMSVDVSAMTFSSSQDAVQNDVGITVPGSKSEQKFSTVSNFALDPEKHSMIIRLLGETADNKPVVAPVTVKAKQKCDTCGTTNKATAKFCHKCGTALVIYA
jgi:hypothetical protein